MPNKIELLAASWLAAKKQEETSRAARIAREEKLVPRLAVKPEGSRTETVGAYKITSTGRITRTLDHTAWARIREQVPEALRPVKIVEQVDDTGCRYLAANEPDIWALCAQAITSTPAKTGVSITKKEEE